MRSPAGIDSIAWTGHAWRNRIQSAVLLAAMGGFLGLLGWLIGGAAAILVLLTVGIVATMINAAVSLQLVTRLYGARALAPAEAPGLFAVLHELAARALARTTRCGFSRRAGISGLNWRFVRRPANPGGKIP